MIWSFTIKIKNIDFHKNSSKFYIMFSHLKNLSLTLVVALRWIWSKYVLCIMTFHLLKTCKQIKIVLIVVRTNEWCLTFYKNKSVIFFFIFKKLGLVGHVKLNIKLVWPKDFLVISYSCHQGIPNLAHYQWTMDGCSGSCILQN